MLSTSNLQRVNFPRQVKILVFRRGRRARHRIVIPPKFARPSAPGVSDPPPAAPLSLFSLLDQPLGTPGSSFEGLVPTLAREKTLKI